MRYIINPLLRCAMALRRYCRAFFHYFVAFSLLTLPMAGCVAPMKIASYKPGDFDSYKNQITQKDIRMAVLPLTDRAQQEKYFGTALTDGGILPVFIIAENQSTSQRYLLRDDHIILQNKTTGQNFPKPLQAKTAGSNVSEGARKGAAAGIGAGTVGVAALGPALAPVAFFSIGVALSQAKHQVDIKAIQDSMFDQTLFTRSVLPGEKASGFAYFKIADKKIDSPENASNYADLILSIEATDETMKSTENFNFRL